MGKRIVRIPKDRLRDILGNSLRGVSSIVGHYWKVVKRELARHGLKLSRLERPRGRGHRPIRLSRPYLIREYLVFGHKPKDIAAMNECSVKIIIRELKRNGIHLRPRGGQNRQHLVGRKFNKLVVVSEAGRLNRHIVWKCKCLQCGAFTNATTSELNQGMRKSCGCLHGGRQK